MPRYLVRHPASMTYVSRVVVAVDEHEARELAALGQGEIDEVVWGTADADWDDDVVEVKPLPDESDH